MTDQFDAPRSEPKRDRYGRYLLPHPNGGNDQPWTRATTFAKSISDSFGLTNWQLRMAVKGVAMRPDLYALAAATPVEDKAKLDRIAADAKEAAAASSGANLGTALHGFTERIDRGEQVDVPAPWGDDVHAYHRALAAAGIQILPQFIERIVVVPELKVAGTLDRIVNPGAGPLQIADVKTGKDLSYGWLEIAIQLALYAHAEAMWDPDGERYEAVPDLDRRAAVVMHLPAGQGRCDLYRVDIAAGWEAAQIAHAVRQWRTRRNLATPLNDAAAAAIVTRELGAIPVAPAVAGLARQATTNTLLERVRTAATVEDLNAIWLEADQAGTWNTALTAAAAARKAQLSRTAS